MANLTLKELIQRLADKNVEVYSKICTVITVDQDARTADVKPINGDPTIFRARLQAAEAGSIGLVVMPKVGSAVIITFTSETRAYIAATSEASGFILRSENESLKDVLNKLLEDIQAITVPTALGPSGVPVNAAAFSALSSRIDNLLIE